MEYAQVVREITSVLGTRALDRARERIVGMTCDRPAMLDVMSFYELASTNQTLGSWLREHPAFTNEIAVATVILARSAPLRLAVACWWPRRDWLFEFLKLVNPAIA